MVREVAQRPTPVTKTARREMWGGSFLQGKTSNVELDHIFGSYLASKEVAVLAASTMPTLTAETVRRIEQRVQQHGVVYFPIFVRHHWIAGIVERAPPDETGRVGRTRLTVYDSAPSALVAHDLERALAKVWPTLCLRNGKCGRQQRYSEDCGLYMAATFFAHRLGVAIRDPDTIAPRLRILLYRAAHDRQAPSREAFLRTIRHHFRLDHATALAALREMSQQRVEDTPKFGGPKGAQVRESCSDGWQVMHGGQPGRARQQQRAADEAKARRRGQATARSRKPAAKPKTKASPRSAPPRKQHPQKKAALAAPKSQKKGPAARKTAGTRAAKAPSTRRVSRATPAPAQNVQPPQESRAQEPNTPQVSPSGESTHLVHTHVERILAEARRAEPEVAERSLCYLLVASALANIADGGQRSLAPTSLGMQSHRLHFTARAQYDIGETLAALGAELDLLVVDDGFGEDAGPPSTHLRLLPRSRSPGKALFVQGPPGHPLPERLDVPQSGVYRFVAGASFTGEIGRHGATEGHYTLTTDVERSVLAVYLPAALSAYPSRTWVQRRRGQRVQPDKAPPRPQECGAPRRSKRPEKADGEGDADAELDMTAEMRRALMYAADAAKDKSSAPLNGLGSTAVGSVVACPRTWYIYTAKPPHVSQLAWTALTPAMRGLHLKWLHELRAMPADLLGQDLASAAIGLVMRMARARRWKWSTTAKAFSAIRGALSNLPLYTNQTRGIDITVSPEWRAAALAAHRFERETIAQPPTPVVLSEVVQAMRLLDQTSPDASLYLAMMWSFAARAGDIGSLQARDVRVIEGAATAHPHQHDAAVEVAGDEVQVVLTIRRGKGAKFRGPYACASSLTREAASQLARVLARRLPRQSLFQNRNELRDRIRTALRKISPGAALPSVRKGAVRHLAAQGVPEAQLMRLTGHTRVDTLHRYLGYGLRLTSEAETALASAGRVLRGSPQ